MPEENAFIGIAVLDDSGSVECEADVTLSIKSPFIQNFKFIFNIFVLWQNKR